MKKVMILYSGKENKDKLFKDAKYQKCYEYLYSLAEINGIKLYRCNYNRYDFSKQLFKQAWTYENNRWILIDEIKPDLIYDKTQFNYEIHLFKEKIQSVFQIINNIDLTLVLSNKLFTNLVFPNFSKKYFPINDKKSLKRVVSRLAGDKVVIKPAVGSGGIDVQVIDKLQIKELDFRKDYLVQEFIDSSDGIKGIVSGMHDLRLVCITGEIIYSYIRQPAKDSYLANIAQGGSMFIVARENLPQQVFEVFNYVEEKLDVYPNRIYTIDLMFDKEQKPWIVELNSMPGLYFLPQEKEPMDKMYLTLINLFKSAIK